MRRTLILMGVCLLSVVSLARAQSTPDPNQFVDVSVEPRETIPLERLLIYPESARRSGLEGAVTLDAVIGVDGRVEKVNVLKSDYDVFKDAAIDAMMRERFTPALQNGTPIKIWITRTIHFRLHNDEGPYRLNREQSLSSNVGKENRPRINFRTIIGSNLDSARDLFKIWGDVEEDKENDGTHLHVKSRPGFANGRFRVTADGIANDSGMRKVIVLYQFQNDEDFASSAAAWGAKSIVGGKLASQSTVADLPNAVATIAVDATERTVRVQLIAK
ncbi:MAG TPA: energy transducer TonB [Candidatus Kapabacteria bacterium]|nr:energy transducer TonB [Candidatus Kapabacteria bacterium]